MPGERVKLQVELEQDAGRRRIARERTELFDAEVEAGRSLEARAQARLELEQEAGRRTAARW
jgi:uncharacterized protein Veg